jgi:ATP-dependent Clp protease ATP-binding subunit ClpA
MTYVDRHFGVAKAALEEALRPESLNCIDEIVVFLPLSYEKTLPQI